MPADLDLAELPADAIEEVVIEVLADLRHGVVGDRSIRRRAAAAVLAAFDRAGWRVVPAAVLDRLEAAEARVVELTNELDDERVAYAELLGGPRAPVPCDCGRALLPVAGRVGLWSCPPCGVSYSFGVPGAVAGEPGGEQQ